MQDVKGLWQSVLGELELNVTRAHFSTWLKPTYIVSSEEGRVVVGVPNIFNKQWLENKYHNQIKSALAKLDNDIHTVEYKVVGKGQVASSAGPGSGVTPKAAVVTREVAAVSSIVAGGDATTSKRKAVRLPAQTALPAAPVSNLNPRYTFDSFVVGGSNDFAHAAARAVAKSPGTKYNPLFIYGGTGLGKTHLMQAVGNEILRHDPSRRVEYVTSETFTNEFISGIMKKKPGAFAEKYRAVDVLIIDDIQFLARAEKTQDEFFHTFNALHQANKQVIITSDKPPQALMGLEERLRSRFEMGITVDIQPPDLETRQAIIQSKAQVQGIVLPLEIVDYIARHAKSNIRELEGTLTKVLAAGEHFQAEPDLHQVQRLLASDAAARPKLKPLSAKIVIERVAAYYDLPVADILGPKRDKEIVMPRQVAMFLMRHDLGLSYPKVGTAIGGRDHTTAMHSVQKIEREVETDEALRADVQTLRQRLSATV